MNELMCRLSTETTTTCMSEAADEYWSRRINTPSHRCSALDSSSLYFMIKVGSPCVACVMCVWRVCGVCDVCVVCDVCDVCVMCVWCVMCVTCVMCVWCVMCVTSVWCVCDVCVRCVWCVWDVWDVCVMCVWRVRCVCDVCVMCVLCVWCVCDEGMKKRSRTVQRINRTSLSETSCCSSSTWAQVSYSGPRESPVWLSSRHQRHRSLWIRLADQKTQSNRTWSSFSNLNIVYSDEKPNAQKQLQRFFCCPDTNPEIHKVTTEPLNTAHYTGVLLLTGLHSILWTVPLRNSVPPRSVLCPCDLWHIKARWYGNGWRLSV